MSKVWGGLTMWPGSRQQFRTIVKARNQREAAAALSVCCGRTSLHEFRGYWSETGNAGELAAMAGKPEGTVLVNNGPPFGSGPFVTPDEMRKP